MTHDYRYDIALCFVTQRPTKSTASAERMFTNPAAWRNAKARLGRDYDIADSLLRLEQRVMPRDNLAVVVRWFDDLPRDQRANLLADYAPTAAHLGICGGIPTAPADVDHDRRYRRPTSWRHFKTLWGPQSFLKRFILELEELAVEADVCPRVALAAALREYTTRMTDDERADAWVGYWTWVDREEQARRHETLAFEEKEGLADEFAAAMRNVMGDEWPAPAAEGSR